MEHGVLGRLVDQGRVYEINGHIGPFGIVASVLGIILWAVVVALLVLLILEAVRRYRHPRPVPGPAFYEPTMTRPPAAPANPDALRILEERYARGEINHEQYLVSRNDLTGS